MAETSTCATCGEQFVARTSGGKVQVRCSEKCRRKAANAGYIKRHAPEKGAECQECGGPVVQLGRGRPRRFCSEVCKAKQGNRAANRRRQPVRQDSERSCEHCGTTFAPTRRDQVYCSNDHPPYCAIKAYKARKAAGEPARQGVEFQRVCVECGEVFTAKKVNAKWCSATCRGRTNARDASRRRGPGEGAERYADRDIFERDEWQCHLCRTAVDPDLPRTDPMGATIDHVIPLSLGGADAPWNVATAHNRCNRIKAARLMELMPA